MDENLWPEMLKRLPTKSLCRFQSVCKGWNSLISSTFFINLRLSFTRSTTPCNLKPYLRVTFRYFESKRLKKYTLLRPLHPKQRLHCPFQVDDCTDHIIYTFIDVIHGVVCISYLNSVILWNPSIHKYVSLPCLSLAHHFIDIGFGYDTSKNDFKVVLILETFGGVVTYQVYSALQGFWRPPVKTTIVKDLIFGINDHTCCYVNGTIHWLLDVSDHYDDSDIDIIYSVLMFDCELEQLTIIDIPEKLFWSSSGVESAFQVELLEYGGMLAVLADHLTFPSSIDMWVMKEYGVSNSWTKLYTIRPDYLNEECITIFDPLFEDMTPYGPNNQRIKCRRYQDYTFRQILSDHVYEESMFLMDHPNVQSYTEKEIVSVLTTDPQIDLKQKKRKKRKRRMKN